MGQKVNPVGLRLGINRGWDSVWYAKKQDFGKYLSAPGQDCQGFSMFQVNTCWV